MEETQIEKPVTFSFEKDIYVINALSDSVSNDFGAIYIYIYMWCA